MEEKTYFTIGEISKLCSVAASTLRYYDQIDLLKPTDLNRSNNYRYYTFKDIAKIRIIQNLRELDFSIDEISSMFQEGDILNQLTIMKNKRELIRKEIINLHNKYRSLNKRIRIIEKEMDAFPSNDIEDMKIKELPKRRILSLRKQTNRANLNLYTLHFNELISHAKKNNIFPSTHLMLIHHHIDVNLPFDQSKYEKVLKDLEFSLMIDPSITLGRVLPEGTYLTFTTKGMAGKDTFSAIYEKIQVWLRFNKYRATGPLIDLLLTNLTNLQPDQIPDNILTEVQIKIEKV
ncbi:hypothetical protein ABE65_011855 [Fictibacillus phosphorivorans]|uniref:HTH merR-type domain-containing protein n=1 Tax=Fictibacillus phosphorivorans TaxID=1221500 RepID=A0A160IMQ1_9BACL|nr:MerR family transcriptional regulator [Fictibacillus phosphorivorans]ANC77454.1 hypothetical protein ABE65_011855 [Fictibacillus phosphorivorans]